jgi:SpoVK/Ycf46/Vps4 family AAA+-type ATPase
MCNIVKKQNVLNLIKYHVERNENAFRNESISIARYFDSIGDYQLAEYVMGLIAESNLYTPQASDFESEFIKQIEIRGIEPLNLPLEISDDIKGIINAVNHNLGINKFLFEGLPGSGKTEAAKHVARLLDRTMYYVNFDNLIDSKLGQTNKNITSVFAEINMIPHPNKIVILFDEIDVIALDRVNSNDVREMGRVTSTILRELDRLTDLNKEIVIIATTNLYSNFDKALTRRFDAVINFNRYSKEDLIEVAEFYFSSFIKNFKSVSKDLRLFKKILKTTDNLPYPGELKNIIKTSLAFSDINFEFDYLRRLYNNLVGNLDQTDIVQLHEQGFTVREIEKLKGESKSTVSRKLNMEENDGE